jgi:hypothetical protein
MPSTFRPRERQAYARAHHTRPSRGLDRLDRALATVANEPAVLAELIRTVPEATWVA